MVKSCHLWCLSLKIWHVDHLLWTANTLYQTSKTFKLAPIVLRNFCYNIIFLFRNICKNSVIQEPFYMKFEVFVAVNRPMVVLWVVTLCGLVKVCQCLRGTYCLHLQGIMFLWNVGIHLQVHGITMQKATMDSLFLSFSYSLCQCYWTLATVNGMCTVIYCLHSDLCLMGKSHLTVALCITYFCM